MDVVSQHCLVCLWTRHRPGRSTCRLECIYRQRHCFKSSENRSRDQRNARKRHIQCLFANGASSSVVNMYSVFINGQGTFKFQAAQLAKQFTFSVTSHLIVPGTVRQGSNLCTDCNQHIKTMMYLNSINESQVIGTIKQQALIDYDISRLLLLMLSRCTRRAAREK